MLYPHTHACVVVCVVFLVRALGGHALPTHTHACVVVCVVFLVRALRVWVCACSGSRLGAARGTLERSALSGLRRLGSSGPVLWELRASRFAVSWQLHAFRFAVSWQLRASRLA
eukprot:11288816-Alexandrium_andersonii.AAC.1